MPTSNDLVNQKVSVQRNDANGAAQPEIVGKFLSYNDYGFFIEADGLLKLIPWVSFTHGGQVTEVK